MTRSKGRPDIGQLMIVGVPGGTPSSKWERRFSDLAPAGVILFGRNATSTDDVQRLIFRLNALAEEGGFSPLLICADEEGGFLSPILGLTDPAPSAMALGSVGSDLLARGTARVTGQRLRSLGVNLNLAPCVDVNDEPMNPVIGPRSFGSDPHLVARLGSETIRGLKAGGVLTTAKHFPGHGSTTVDSHKALPVDARSLDALRSGPLIPFRAAVDAGVDLVMTAHVAFPAVTGADEEPATFSRRIVGEILRKELGFDGVVISDAMEMAGAADCSDPEEGALRTLAAGVDLLLYTRGGDTPWRIRQYLEEAVARGPLSEERVTESAARVARVKLGLPDQTAAYAEGGIFEEVRARSIRILEDPLGLVPLEVGPECSLGVLVPDPGLPEGSIDVGHLRRELQGRVDRWTLITASPHDSVPVGELEKCDSLLVFVLSRGPLDAWQADLLRRTSSVARQLILVAALNPFVLPELEIPAARIATFDFSPPAITALMQRIFA